MKFTDKLIKLPKQTYSIEVEIEWDEIEAVKEKAVFELQKTTEIKGFRKGKAPLKLIKETLGDQKILDEASKLVLTEVYKQLLVKHSLKPFIDPKITLLKAPQGNSWQFRIELAQAPLLTKIADYHQIAKEIAGEQKKNDIWVPGKQPEKEQEEKAQKQRNQKIQVIFNKIMKDSEIEISQLILDLEINRRLTALYDEIKQLGLTVEQYLETKKLDAQSLRRKTEQEIVDLYKSEFLLEQIANAEKITVNESDLDTIFKQAKNEKERELLKSNSYLYSRLLRKQKTLDFLANL